MELKIDNLEELYHANIIQTAGRGLIFIKIGNQQHTITLLKTSGNELEFILNNSYHQAKIIRSDTYETKLMIDDTQMTIKKHPNMQEILRKSITVGEAERGENAVTSQIPGRVVNIVAQTGTAIKKGDSVLILESMKMQVAVKAHKDGSVKQIKVKEGTTVARNDIVAIID
jgi:biotin carboxyl carrier protein